MAAWTADGSFPPSIYLRQAAACVAVLKAGRSLQLLTDLHAPGVAGLGAGAVESILRRTVVHASENVRWVGVLLATECERHGCVCTEQCVWSLYAYQHVARAECRIDTLQLACVHPKGTALPTALELGIASQVRWQSGRWAALQGTAQWAILPRCLPDGERQVCAELTCAAMPCPCPLFSSWASPCAARPPRCATRRSRCWASCCCGRACRWLLCSTAPSASAPRSSWRVRWPRFFWLMSFLGGV